MLKISLVVMFVLSLATLSFAASLAPAPANDASITVASTPPAEDALIPVGSTAPRMWIETFE